MSLLQHSSQRSAKKSPEPNSHPFVHERREAPERTRSLPARGPAANLHSTLLLHLETEGLRRGLGVTGTTSHKWQENYHLHTVNKASLHSASERQPRRGFSSQDSNKASSQTSKQVGKPIQVTEGPMWSRVVSSVPQLMASKFLDNRTKKQKEVASSGPKCFPIVSLKDKCGFSKIS